MTSRAHGRAPTDDAPEPERAPRLPTTPSPLPGAPAQILALQRSAGNAAVSAALGRPMLMRSPESDAVLDAIRSAPGGEYEFKIDLHKTDRVSGSLRFSLQSSRTVLKGKADAGETGPSAGDTSAQLLPAKMTFAKSAGAGTSRSMAAALAKADLTVAELVPGLTMTADIKGLEAKLENGDIDVNVFKVGVQLQGALSKDMAGTELGDAILGTGFGELLKGGLTVKVQARLEVGIDPSDLVRLQRMALLNQEIASNLSQSVADHRKISRLEFQNQKIRQRLVQRGLSKEAREALRAQAKRNSEKVAKLRKRIAANKEALKGLRRGYSAAAKGLKSKAGRTIGLMVKQVGGALLKRLIPGLNIAFAVLDVLEVSAAIWKLIEGKAWIGLPTDEEEAEGGEGGEAGGAAQDGATGGGSGDTGVDPTDAGVEHDADLPDGEFAEISIDDEPEAETAPAEAHAAAEQVLDAFDPGGGGTPIDVAQLNALIPADLTAEEQLALLAELKGTKGTLTTDPIGVMEAVQRAMEKVRPAESATTVEDASGTETLPEAGTGDGKSEGLRDEKTGGGEIGSGKIRYVRKLQVEGVSLAHIHFTSIKGVSAATKPRKKPRTLTVTFTHEGVQRTVRFLIVVKHAEPDGSQILAENQKTWEIPDTGIHMRAGETVTLYPDK